MTPYLAAADATRSLTIKDDRYIDQNITWTQTLSEYDSWCS